MLGRAFVWVKDSIKFVAKGEGGAGALFIRINNNLHASPSEYYHYIQIIIARI